MAKLRPGDSFAPRTLTTIDGVQEHVPSESQLVHLQFRRFAGCPMCTVHLRSLALRHEELIAASLREVVVFRATAEALRVHHGDLPFAIVADPLQVLCEALGVESSLRAPLDPRAWAAGLRGAIQLFPKLPTVPPRLVGALGLPADFLIEPGGRVLACKYGEHAYDQWSVDEVLQLAGVIRREGAPA